MDRLNLIGHRSGRLLVLEPAKTNGRAVWWRCRCDCGSLAVVRADHLIHRETVSCGCVRRETTAQRSFTHGDIASSEYRIWAAMKRRCELPTVREFANYGGRGIFVCATWRTDYPQFLRDMGRRPTPKHSIDRIDNNGPYAPDNCRWATQDVQANNTRTNHMITFNGLTQTIMQWQRHLGYRPGLIANRLKDGWSVERTLTTPPRKMTRRSHAPP